MPKPQDIFQLAQQEAVRVTASPQAWQSFLYTAAHNYHTTYLNQLLIHAQRPDAAACASMEYWNTKANRLVMRGSRSITVLQRRQGMAVTKPIFTIGDTTLLSQTRTGGPWEVTDTTRPLLLQGKPDDWLSALAQEGVSNEADRARRMLERNVADSTLQWAQPDEQMQLLQALVTQSAVYMALLRIGLPVRDEDFPAFQSASQFDTYQISLCLGGYVQAAAEPMLNAIGREALRLNRDSIAIPHEPVHNESTPTQLDSREEAVTHDVHEEPRRLPDSEPFPAEPAEPVSEPLREAASGISGAERADALRPADAGGHAADELQSNRTSRTADGGQNSARADADHPDAGPQDEPTGLDADDQQPEKAGGGSSPSDAVRSLTEAPAEAESEQALSAFSLPEFSPTLLPQLLAAETSSRASNAEYLTFYNKNPLLIDRLRFVRESYKDIFTELLLADDTRVGFHRQDNGLLVWQGAYLTRSAETLLPWRAVANALNDLIEQHELIAAIDPKELPQVEEQLSFELPDGSPPSAENDRLEKDDFLTPEKQETVIRSALPVAEYNAPQMDDGSVITDEEINLALAAGSNFENSKFRIYQQFTTTQGDHAAFLKKEYGSGGRSWDYQSGAHGWVDHGPAGLKLILTNEEGRFERRLPWRAAAKRIAYLIEMQRFLTPQELEQYPAWAAEQRKVASVVRDEPGNVPDTRPICAEGSVVYLEDDHRFTVERIGQFDVHLRDEEAPLFGRAISREEFQRQLNANPRNGGMMLSEQQHEALVQTQTEQALSYIEDYLKDEFEITEPDFSDLTRIDLGYTTTEDEKHVIQVYADLEHCTVTKLVDDTLYAQERYGSLDDLNQAVLSNLDFDSLMEIDLDEAEEHEPQENALPTDESAAHDPTNYLAPYGRSGSVGPYTTKEAADAAANSERDSAVAAIQAEAQSAVNNAIASAQAQLASLQFRYDEVTIPYGFESYWGSNGSHQTITVPANSNNAYKMRNAEWSLQIKIKKTDSETGNQIAGDARYEIYQWDVVTGKYQPTGGYNTYSVQRQGDGTYAVINNAAYATNDTMRHTLYYTQRNEGRFILVETKAPAGYFGDWTDIAHPGTAGTPLGKRAYYVEITADNNNSVLWLGNGDYNADIATGDKGGTKLVTSGGVETTVTIYDSPKDASRSYTTDASGKAANEDG